MSEKSESDSKCANFDYMRLLRIFGACAGLASLAVGIVMIITSGFSPKNIINGVYSCIFGIMIVISEARWSHLLKHFKFLTHFIGLGLFYLFVGGLALGGEWYQIAIAIVLLSVGLIYLLLGLCCRTMEQPGFDDVSTSKQGAATTSNNTSNNATKTKEMKKEPDTVTDLKKKVAHAAVDHAIDNNTNPFA